MRIRLLSAVELDALRDTRLHDFLVQQHTDDVTRMTEALGSMYPANSDVTLETLQESLATHLKENGSIRTKVRDEAAIGGTPLDENGLYKAMAGWIIERQLAGRLDWNPQRRPRGTSRLRLPGRRRRND